MGGANRGNRTILLAEDQPAVRRLFGDFLRLKGYQVLEAGDGAEASLLFRRHPDRIDALVTDVMMPGMNGANLAASLRSESPGLVVLFVSGFNDVLAAEILDQPRTAYLQKPFPLNALERVVSQLLASQP